MTAFDGLHLDVCHRLDSSRLVNVASIRGRLLVYIFASSRRYVLPLLFIRIPVTPDA
jgi:hypothetical protein